MQYSTKKLAENKLIILHLLQKMGIALSNSEICQFLLEKNYMDYFSVQQYLSELEGAGWLEKTKEQNNTRYTLTDDGEDVMNYFISRISDEVKNHLAAVDELGITWPQIIDSGAEAAEAYNIQAIPFIILFAPDGTVYRQNLRGDQLEAAVKEVL